MKKAVRYENKVEDLHVHLKVQTVDLNLRFVFVNSSHFVEVHHIPLVIATNESHPIQQSQIFFLTSIVSAYSFNRRRF